MSDVLLSGCQPEPLGSYLKALAVLRIVSEQCDPTAMGRWSTDGFILTTRLSKDELVSWFAEDYQPCPIANPWNGAGGFYFREQKSTGLRTAPTAATRNLEAMMTSQASRLSELRRALDVARHAVDRFGLTSAPAPGEPKHALAAYLRDRLSDRAVAWLDAVLVVGSESLGFPPVLGTGGTEGALDFASNFYQRLQDVFDRNTGAPKPSSRSLLNASLFGTAFNGRIKAAIGQFDPGGAGGGNAGPGFDGRSSVNPWDFVLLLEGTLMLASATSRKLESARPGSLAYPFSVRSVGADYATAHSVDEEASRHELWLPLWTRPTGLPELQRLFGEGRADVDGKRAVHAVDFARAVGTLGVDRGIDAFTRYGFHKRNGKSYLATPLGRWRVEANPTLDLVEARLAQWIDRLRRAAQGKNAPASWGRSAKSVERALFAMAKGGNPRTVQAFLISLGRAEVCLGATASGRQAIQPVPTLNEGWLDKANDRTTEHVLARSLASTDIRERLSLARREKYRFGWMQNEDHRTVWLSQDAEIGLLKVVRRQQIERSSVQSLSTNRSGTPPTIDALWQFLYGRVDLARLTDLALAYSLIPPASWSLSATQRVDAPAVYAACALTHHRIDPTDLPDAPPMHQTRGLVPALAAGKGLQATTLAVRRLHAQGLAVGVGSTPMTARQSRRIGAALAFPVNRRRAKVLYDAIKLINPLPNPTEPSEP